jgi:hypothetical protein
MLDLMTPPRCSGDGEPLLGLQSGTLALRIGNGSHRGRVIQIRSPKCTVGSAPGCTLRLRASGVRPLHCWILRGPAGTMIRRRCAGTLLNGQAYDDAPLQSGDHLRIGSVELEVVDLPPREAIAPTFHLSETAPPADPTASNERIRELEACLNVAHDEIARLEGDAQQAWQTSITAAERAEQMRVALENAHVEAGEVRGELDTALAALQTARQQAPAQLAELQQTLAGTEQRLASSTEALNRGQQELEEQASRFAREREAFEQQICQLRGEVEQARFELARQGSQMTVAMDQLRAETQGNPVAEAETRCAALEAELQGVREELNAARHERDLAASWESRFRDAEGQIEHWQGVAQGRQSQLEDWKLQLAAERTRQAEVDAAVQRQLEELKEQGTALAAGTEQLNSEQRRLADLEAELNFGSEALQAERTRLNDQAAQLERRARELNDQTQELAGEKAELDQSRENLAQENASCESRWLQMKEAESALAAVQEELAAVREELMAAREQLAAERENLAAERTGLELEREQLSRQAAEQQAAAEQAAARGADPVQAAADDRFQPVALEPGTPGAGPASDSADLQGIDSVAKPPESAWPAAGGADEAEQASESSEPAPVSNHAMVVTESPAGQVEESIEKFMEQLMQRVGGDSTKSPRPPVMPALQSQLDEFSRTTPQVGEAGENPGPVKQREYVPRSQTPEQLANLAAMRELGNSAARSAIETHHQKSGNKQVAGRLLAAGVVLLGSALLGYWAWEISSVTAGVGAAIGLLVGSLWALRGFARLLGSLRLTRPQPLAEEPAPADANLPEGSEASPE